MVSVVLVSHSARIAEGIAELARGMAGPEVALAAVGGLDLPDHPLGTDPKRVHQAIEQVYSDDGVIVLIDLGSALLSAEMAVEQFSPEQRARIAICEAPLVEGAVAASVQARLGSSLEQVLAEARDALAAKKSHLAAFTVAGAAPTPAASRAAHAGTHELRLTVHNHLGLHARPAARFAQTAGRFAETDLRVSNLTTGRGPVSAKSINGVTTLGIRRGHEILVSASGQNAEAALAAIRSLADGNFGDGHPNTDGENRNTLASRSTTQDQAPFAGFPASPGIALGPARLFQRRLPEVPIHTVIDPHAEWERLVSALEKTREQLVATRDSIARRADGEAAAIFEAHTLFLEDEALREPARAAIFNEQFNAAAAWQRAVDQVASAYQALDDDYLRARAADVSDVGRQVLSHLLDHTAAEPITAPGILIAPDLAPADTAALDPQLVLGIATAYGGPTSHSAILARSLGIPAVVGLGEAVLRLSEGTPLILDGRTGEVWPQPEPQLSAEYHRRAAAERSAQAEARAASAEPAITRDRRRVEVAANIGSLADARAAVDSGAEGVGLFRTEFLFLDRREAPNEDEQYAAYRAVAEALAGRPVIIRTLDVGGDKPLPYLDLGAEANPFLGWRAIRLCLARPDFFKVQLRALVRLAAEYPVKIMFPMIATLTEWREARALLDQARADVRERGRMVPDKIDTGIMVEVPAAALHAAQFAAEADFFSIGTNDLTQYTLAAERGNARVAALADALEPAVLHLIRAVVQAAHARRKWVGVCGELAGDPLAVPLLVGLGVDELSLSPPAIPSTKQIIRRLMYAAARAQALSMLGLETAAAVRQKLAGKS